LPRFGGIKPISRHVNSALLFLVLLTVRFRPDRSGREPKAVGPSASVYTSYSIHDSPSDRVGAPF
jgi:hypothetical protein